MSTASNKVRGLVVHDYRVRPENIDTASTTATQAGPYAGPAVDQGASDMVLRTSGDIAANESYTVTIERGGMPGSDTNAAGFSYTRNAATYYWDPPVCVSGVQFVNFRTTGAGTSSAYKEYEPSLCRLADGRILMATRALQTGPGTVSIRIRRYDPSTNVWTVLTTLTDATIDDAVRIGPCLVLMPTGAVHLYYWIYTDNQYALWVSDDDGASFSKSSTAILSTPFPGAYTAGDYGVGLRGSYSSGQVALIASYEGYGVGKDNFFSLLTSTDGGYRFIADLSYSTGTNYDDSQAGNILPMDGGGFWFVLAEGSALDDLELYQYGIGSGIYDIRSIGVPFMGYMSSAQPFSDGSKNTTVEGGTMKYETSVTAWQADGATYCMYGAGYQAYGTPSARGSVAVRRAVNPENSEEWDDWIITDRLIDHGSGAGDVTCIRRPSVVETQGLSVLACEVRTQTGEIDDGTIAVLYLGGHSTITVPPSTYGDTIVREPWGWQYHALGDPDDGGGWQSGASTGTLTLESIGVHLSCDAAQRYYFTPKTGEEPVKETAELLFEMAVSSVVSPGHTGAVNQPRCGALLTYRHNAGAAQYTVLLNLSSTGITLYDIAGSSSLGTASVDLSGEVEIRVALYRGRINAWYREVDSRVERKWTQVVTNGAVTGAAVSVSTHVVQWGMISTAASGTHEMYISRVQLMELDSDTSVSSVGVADLDPYPRFTASKPIMLPGGLTIEAVDGPAAPGDSWVIQTAYQYGFENLTSHNPGKPWRSTADYTDMEIVWDLNAGLGSSDLAELAQAIGAAVLESNLSRWSIHFIPGSGSGTAADWIYMQAGPWAEQGGDGFIDSVDSIGSILQHTGLSTVYDNRWIRHNELAGTQAHVGTFTSGDTIYRIKGNSSGWLTGDPAARRVARIWLDPNEDAIDDIMNTTGLTVYLQVRNTAAVSWEYSQYATADTGKLVLSIPAQHTYEGYYEIGRFMFGPFHAFGREYGEDRTIDLAHNVELSTRRDGSRLAHSRGRQRRSVTVNWRQGIDETELYTTSVTTRDGFISDRFVAADADTAALVQGIFGEVDGPSEPVLYLPAVSVGSLVDHITTSTGLLYGRIVSQLEITQVVGNEEEDPVYRIGSVRIEEEIG